MVSEWAPTLAPDMNIEYIRFVFRFPEQKWLAVITRSGETCFFYSLCCPLLLHQLITKPAYDPIGLEAVNSKIFILFCSNFWYNTWTQCCFR